MCPSTDPPSRPLALSILVEWGNALHTDPQYSRQMLRAVTQQATDLVQRNFEGMTGPQRACLSRFAGALEILVLFDSQQCSESTVREAARACADAPTADVCVRLVDTPGRHYYAMKNRGAELARGDMIVFVDSDVVPEPGWLLALLSTFADPGVDVVAGHTYLRTDRFFARAFAAGWFFPPQARHTGIVAVDTYFANNLAIPRALFLAYPFPDLPGTTRGACGYQAALLKTARKRLVRNLAARAVHPPPEPEYFLVRALAQGRDYATQNLLVATHRFPHLPRKNSLLGRAGISLLRIGAVPWHARRVGLSALEVLPAMAVMTAYYLVAIGAEAATYLFPSWMQARFRV